jgi:hypothetical protein
MTGRKTTWNPIRRRFFAAGGGIEDERAKPPKPPEVPPEVLPVALNFDYRMDNVTAQAALDAGKRDLVVLWRQADTALGRAQMDVFRNGGGRLWISIEPWCRTTNDLPTIYASDVALFDLAQEHDAWLRTTSGTITHPAPEFFGPLGARGLDFADFAFAEEWADWIHTRWPDITGVYHDYGFPNGGLSWVNGYKAEDGVPWPGNWETWAEGYRRAFDYERTYYPSRPLLLAQYGNQPDLEPMLIGRATGVIIEGIGNVETPSFFTYKQAWKICQQSRDNNLEPMLWDLHSSTRNRRIIGCMAVATNAYMEWRWRDLGFVWGPQRIPEISDLSIGNITWPAVQISTDVWKATGTRGYVVVNCSTGSSSHASHAPYVVAANDGLMVQTHAVNGDPLAPVLTNVGI